MTPKSKSSFQSATAKLNKILDQSKKINAELDNVNRKLDILIVIELARSGLNLREVANILGVSEDTIERMLPFRKLKSK